MVENSFRLWDVGTHSLAYVIDYFFLGSEWWRLPFVRQCLFPVKVISLYWRLFSSVDSLFVSSKLSFWCHNHYMEFHSVFFAFDNKLASSVEQGKAYGYLKFFQISCYCTL